MPRCVIFAEDNHLIQAHIIFETREVFLDRLRSSFLPFETMVSLFHEAYHASDVALNHDVSGDTVVAAELEAWQQTKEFVVALKGQLQHLYDYEPGPLLRLIEQNAEVSNRKCDLMIDQYSRTHAWNTFSYFA